MSTKTALRSYNTSIVGCAQCKYYTPALIFQLCKHPKAEYFINGTGDWHTCQHMRETHGACGHEKRLAA